MKRAKGKLQSTWPIGLTTIVISSEHLGLQPHWKRIETELFKLADRCRDDPLALAKRLRELAVKISVL